MVVGLLAFGVFHNFAPAAAAWALETRFSKQRADPSLIHLSLHPQEHAIHYLDGASAPRPVPQELVIPLDASGLRGDTDLVNDLVRMTITRQNGETSRWEGASINVFQHREGGFLVIPSIERSFYEKAKWEPVRVDLNFQLTLVGNPVSTSIEWGQRRVPVPGVGMCDMIQRPADLSLLCISALRPPAAVLVVNKGEVDQSKWFFGSTSYSPLPAALALPPTSYFVHQAHGPSATLTTMEPLVHFRRDLEAPDLILADYEIRPRYK
jgi:hypothetical protein